LSNSTCAATARECDAIARRLAATNAALAEQAARGLVLEGRVRMLEEAAAVAAASASGRSGGPRTSFHVAHPNATPPRRIVSGGGGGGGAAAAGGGARDDDAADADADADYGAGVGASEEWGTASLRGSQDWSVLAASMSAAAAGAAADVGAAIGSPRAHAGAPPAESAETGAFIEYYSRLLGVSKETLTADGDGVDGGDGDSLGAQTPPEVAGGWD
jgi:hypothetical protein